MSNYFNHAMNFVSRLFNRPTYIKVHVRFTRAGLMRNARHIRCQIRCSFHRTRTSRIIRSNQIRHNHYRVLMRHLLIFTRLIDRVVHMNARIRNLNVCSTNRIRVTKTMRMNASRYNATMGTIYKRMFIRLFRISVTIRNKRRSLLLVRRVNTTLRRTIGLRLLRRRSPRIQLTNMFLQVMRISQRRVTIFAILQRMNATLLTSLLSIQLPYVSRISIFIHRFLRRRAMLSTRSTNASRYMLRIPHSSLMGRLTYFSDQRSRSVKGAA